MNAETQQGQKQPRVVELVNAYRALPEEEKNEFLHSLSMWLLLGLPDGEYLLLTKEEFRELRRSSGLYQAIMQTIRPFLLVEDEP